MHHDGRGILLDYLFAAQMSELRTAQFKHAKTDCGDEELLVKGQAPSTLQRIQKMKNKITWLILLLALISVTACSGANRGPDLPGGLTAGVWQQVGRPDGMPFLIIPATGNKIHFSQSQGTYEVVDEEKLVVSMEAEQPYIVEVIGEEETVILTISQSSGREFEIPVKRILEDTSSGNYMEDLQGDWTNRVTGYRWVVTDNEIHEFIETEQEIANGQTTEDSVDTLDEPAGTKMQFELIENRIVIEGENFSAIGQLVSMGDLIAIYNNSGNPIYMLERIME